MAERDPLLAVSHLLPDRLKTSLLAAHRRARDPTTDSHPTLQTLRAVLNADTSVEDGIREQFLEAIRRSPNPIYTADEVLSVLRTSSDDKPTGLAQILASVRAGFKIIQDGGKGIRKLGEDSKSTPLELRQSSGPSSSSSTPISSPALRTTQLGRVAKPGSAAESFIDGASCSTARSSRSGFSRKIHKRKPLRTCEISGYTTPKTKQKSVLEAAHILPLACVGDHPKNQPMWNLLSMFWSSQDVEDLREALRSKVNNCGNGLLMKPDVHKFWDDMGFYVEVDWNTVTPEQYTATFQWNGEPDYVTNYWHTDGNPDRRQDIKSGDLITFSTPNAEKFPLPDPYLLLIRSTLMKLSLPSASAENDEDFDYDSSLYFCNLTEQSSLSDRTTESPKSHHDVDATKSSRLSKKSIERAKLEPPGTKGGISTDGGSVSIVEDWIANQPMSFEDLPET